MKNYNKLKRREGKKTLGKRVQALRNIFLIGVFLLGVGNWDALAQSISSDIPSGLVMSKQWVPTSDDGTKGNVILETYVTGSTITSVAAVPNDIVLVVDQSGSMADPMGSGTRLDALKTAVTNFCTMVKDDAVANGVNHKIAIVGFATGYQQSNGRWTWTNTELLSTQYEQTYGNYQGNCVLTQGNYRDALVVANNNGSVNNRLTQAVTRLAASGGTCMQWGLEMAYGVLSNRTETTFTGPDGTTKPRGQIVIFFTDGYPGIQFPASTNIGSEWYWNGDRVAERINSTNYNWISQTVADGAVARANNLKNNGATVFSVGIFGGADPTSPYITVRKGPATTPGHNGYTYYYWEPETLPAGEDSGDAAANGLLHMISSNYDGTLTPLPDSWSNQIVSTANVANRFVEHTEIDPDTGEEYTWSPKYFSANSASELNAIFSSLASQSGAEPLEMSEATVVQDQVSNNFTLPAGADAESIRIYAPLCTAATMVGETVTSCTFADTLTQRVGNTIQYLTLNGDGTVQANPNKENRLPSSLITFKDDNGNDLPAGQTSKNISISGFNFKEMFCGLEGQQGQLHPRGRKLVIVIPLEVEEGVWGDGIETNGPLTFVLPDGSQVAYAFECPITNVLGDVWTEVVTSEPTGFDPMNIDSPEDLAWFISKVNGRVFYNHNNTIASNPTLNGRLTADIDMSAHNWVPIGAGYMCNDQNQFVDANGQAVTAPTVKLSYQGTFDGNGHVITGLKNNADKWFKTASAQENQMVVYPGMFSNIGPQGIVHDVFILDADFRGKHHNAHFIHHGILADTLTGGQIYNCEAAGRLTCNNDAAGDVELIYGGLVGLNRNDGTIHSSMAMATLTAYTLGGGVGENRSSFTNSFTNGVYNYLGETGNLQKPVGGLAGKNSGTIDNCYVRFERENTNLDKAAFKMLCGTNTGTLSNCYSPEWETYSRPSATGAPVLININNTVPNSDNDEAHPYTITVSPAYYNYFTNDNKTLGSWGWSDGFPVYQSGSSLLDMLNENKGDGAPWKRTTAGNYDEAHGSGDINDDYPVLQLGGYNCLASTDGITIDYGHTLDEILDRHNTGAMNANTVLPGAGSGYTGNSTHDYHVSQSVNKPQSDFIYGASINLFVNENTSRGTSTAAGTVVYIDEDISLLQSTSAAIEAYTGQTLKSYQPDGKERWHLISSSLANSQFGWTYGTNEMVPHNWDPNPCGFTLQQTDEDRAFFPIDLISYRRVDFYSFYEERYHWINFKRNTLSHWHMNDYSLNIPYTNETQFVQGKGYLASIDMSTYASYNRNGQFVQNRGTLNNGVITIPVTCTANIAWSGRQGYNLIGNPYQSYLDFDEFVRVNSDVMGNSAFANTFAVYDPKIDAWRQYKSESSKCSYAEGTRYLNMHQGFIIQVMDSDDVTFNNDMRTNDPGEDFEGFRGEQNNYPLINFIMSDSNGNKEIAVLEVGRPENDGAKKLFVSTSNSFLYLRHDSEDYAILFRDLAFGTQPLYFEAKENGTFTLSWNTANANFSSLTLVDNITGRTIDMLANDSYTFEGNVDHYKSRFKVIFGRFTGIDEDMDTASESFAYFDGSEWIVEGQGSLTVTDMMGRTVYSTTLSNEQNRVNLNGLSQGVYLMRIADSNNTMVQKIVVK